MSTMERMASNAMARVKDVFRSSSPERSSRARQPSRTGPKHPPRDGSPTRKRARDVDTRDSERRRETRTSTPTPRDRPVVRDQGGVAQKERQEEARTSETPAKRTHSASGKKYEPVEDAYKGGFYPSLTSSPPAERAIEQPAPQPLEPQGQTALGDVSSSILDDRSQVSSDADTSWRPDEELVKLREEIKSLRAAQQSAQSDQVAAINEEKKKYKELDEKHRVTREQLQDKRNRYNEVEAKDGEQIRLIARLEADLREYQEAYKNNAQVAKQQSSHVQTLEEEAQQSRARIEELEKERERVIANRLQMDAFDNSVDRVSEAQLVGAMDSISSSVDELVSNLLDEVTEIASTALVGTSNDAAMLPKDVPVLLQVASRSSPNSDQWGLLVDALLHQKLVEWLYRTLFSTTLGIPSSDPTSMGQLLEDMYTSVSKNENWRAAQRWRAMTSKVTRHMVPASSWKADRRALLEDVVESLAIALGLHPSMLSTVRKRLDRQLADLFEAAQSFVSLSSQDMLSVRVRVVLGSHTSEARDIVWADMGQKPDDGVVSDYSLGLVKVDESHQTTVLRRPKVTSDALLRHTGK